MSRNAPVPASEFTRNFGRYRMLAQRQPIAVTSHGEITGYFVQAEDFEEYLQFRAGRRSFATRDLPPERVKAVKLSRMDKKHGHLNALLD